jgi:hypothetical protein
MTRQYHSGIPFERRLWERVEKTRSCWLWRGNVQGDGYGTIMMDGRLWLVHRCVWTVLRGPIPEGVQLLHTCDTPACCNPDHLFLGSQLDNIADMVRKGRQRGAPGSAHPAAKLTDDDVRAIRAIPVLPLRGGRKQQDRELALKYGVSASLISQIRRGVVWKHLL